MQINRRFLYVGLFLMTTGGVLVATDLGLDTATLTDALRLWPLAVIAIGLGVVLRRTRFSLQGGVVAAAVPGLVLGSALAVAPRWAGDCGAATDRATSSTQQGTFQGPASISVSSGCGSLTVETMPGNGWQLTAGSTAGRAPTVRSSPQSLSIDSRGSEQMYFFSGGRDTWDLALPTSEIDDLSLVAFASHSNVALPGARIGRLALTANASEIVVDASESAVANLSAVVNVGLLSIHVPADSDLVGSVHVGGGELEVCTPPGVGLRLATNGGPSEVTVEGRRQSDSEWQSPDYASTTHRADLRVTVNFGTVRINPIGGCK